MAITVTVTRTDAEQNSIIVEGTLTPTGSYSTGGDTVDFSTVPQIPSNSVPLGAVDIWEQPAHGSTPAGYIMYFIAGSTIANGLIWFATADGQPPTELSAAGYPNALKAATIQFRARFTFGI